MEAIKEVGAFAGLAAFLGLAVLALLYFAQARDVRRLRENAEFLVEGDPMPTHPEDMEDEGDAARATAGKQPKAAARAAAASAPTDAEAFRRAELARQAAQLLHRARGLATNARDELRNELGPDYADPQLRDLDPRTIVRKHISEAMAEVDREQAHKDEQDKLPPGQVPPYDVEAT